MEYNELNKKLETLQKWYQRLMYIASIAASSMILFITHNILFSVITTVIVDFILSFLEMCAVLSVIKNTSTEELEHFVTFCKHNTHSKNADFLEFASDYAEDILHEREKIEEVQKDLKEETGSFDDEVQEFKSKCNRLNEAIKNADITKEMRKEIRDNLSALQKEVDEDPMRVRFFGNKFNLLSDEIMSLILLCKDNKEDYKEQLDSIFAEFNKYLVNLCDYVNTKQHINIASSINVLLDELRKENAK